ncbi:hypothetical protein HZA40_01440 [Candidatus Peregrinibacteria bacterium]|nr:hypothetical protein [Candidatus Peregrinibacteria bacterium]
MSGENQKPDVPQENPKEAMKKEGKWKWNNLSSAFSKAKEKVKKAKEKGPLGLWTKITIFWETFSNEMKGIKAEEKKVSAEAKAEAGKSIKAKMKEAKEAVKLDDKTPAADKEFYDEVLAMGVTAGNELPVELQDAFKSGKGKLAQAVRGETPEDSTLDEVKAMAGAGLLTVTKLKAKYNNPTKFKDALDRLDKISDSSAYPLKKLLSMTVLKIFKIKIDVAGEALKGVGSMLRVSEKGDGMKLLDSLNLSVSDAKKLGGLKKQPIENESNIVAVMKKSIFPNTDEGKIRNVAKIVNKLLVEKPDRVDNQVLTNLVFNIDDRDMKRLIEILTGKKAEGAKIA